MKKLVCAALLFGLSLVAADKPAATPKTPTITQTQVDKLTIYWRGVLLLNDWEVQTHVVRLADLTEGSLGNGHWNYGLQRGTIMVLDPRDYAEIAKRDDQVPMVGKAIIEDIEDTIVHELVHLRLASMADMMPENREAATIDEMTVVRVTKALLAVRHHR